MVRHLIFLGGVFNDSHFGLGNRLNYNSFDGVVGKYGLNATTILATLTSYTLNATYNWWGSCTGPGFVGVGSGSPISTNVDFSPWLGACIGNKTFTPQCVLPTDEVILYANITSNACIGDVTFSVFLNNSWQNFSGVVSNSGIGNYSTTIGSSLLTPGTSYTYTAYVSDCFNHTIRNGNHTFYVNHNTSLTVSPVFPDGWNNWYVTEPTFTLANPDAVGSFYQWDGSGPLDYLGPFGLDNITNAPPKESAGILKLTWWSNLTCGEEKKQNRTFFIDLVNPDITNLIPVNASQVVNNKRPLIQALLDEIFQSNSGINHSSARMYLDGSLVSADIATSDTIDAIINHTPLSDLSDGFHNVKINVTDFSGRNSEFTWLFEILTISDFNKTLYSPLNTTYDTRRVPFNITTTNKSSEIEYLFVRNGRTRVRRLCRNCDDYGFSRKRTQTLREGENNITIIARDLFGIVDKMEVSLFIDSKKPRVSRSEPRRNKVTNGSHFSIKYSETNLQSVVLSFNPNISLVNCTSGRNQICSTSVDLTGFDNTSIEYHFIISDSINTVNSRSTKVFVDITSPTLSVHLPINDSIHGRRVPFNLTASEKVTMEYMDHFDSRPRWRRLCLRCDSYGFDRTKVRGFRVGTHNLEIRAVDRAGNSDKKELSFEVV